MVAEIAVAAAVFAIDKPYSYRIPEGLSPVPGVRVIVPFGRGNKRCEGFVLSLSDKDPEGLKPIERVLDEEPVLTERRLKTAAFLCSRYFCTFYEAARAMLPAGLWFQVTEFFSVVREAGDWHEIIRKNKNAAAVMQVLEDLGGSTDIKMLRSAFPEEESLRKALRYLQRKGMIASNVDMAQRVSEKTEKIASLAVPAEEASAFAAKKQRSAPLQKSVLELLCAIGSGSCREILYLTGASMGTLRRLQTLGMIALSEREVFRGVSSEPIEPLAEPTLNDEQSAAFRGLSEQLSREKPGAALLYGVTGSGKTAVYIRLIYETLRQDRSAVLLVPEIALTPQLLRKLRAHFGTEVAVLHSSLRVGERYDEWRRIRDGKARVVVGTRSAVFAPTENTGLFIVDEEQEHTYKSENVPRYHAAELALYRGMQENALVLLGSATPSVESMYRAESGVYSLYRLTSRYNGKPLPPARIVDLKKELQAGNAGTVSAELHRRLKENIETEKQSILFLNRRGNSRCLVCVDCGEAPSCPRCSVHLTYHSANNRLMCHYCGYSQTIPERCPDCGGHLKPIGSGTQKIEQELKSLFPDTQILRMDADTLSASNNHEAILSRFVNEKIPILLGTQMVTKGLDFENVTLVGVMDADLSLYVNHFRAAETTFSLITQVVGRAGRGDAEGTALIQTMTPQHPVILLAAEQDYDAFYRMEVELRRLRRLPPFGDQFTVHFMGLHEQTVLKSAMRMRSALEGNLRSMGSQECELLGPTADAVSKVNYVYHYHLILSAKNSPELRRMLAYVLRQFSADPKNRGVGAYIDVNAYD